MSQGADPPDGLDECIHAVLELSTIIGDWIITGYPPPDAMEQILAMHFHLNAFLPSDDQHPRPRGSA